MNTQKKIQEVELEIVNSQKQVELVMGNVLKRGDKLEDLQYKSENMRQEASMFEKRTKQLKRSMWWKKAKVLVIIGLVIVVIIAIAIIIVAV